MRPASKVSIKPGEAHAEHEQFFREFKETLKQRFQQLEIWLTSHDIRVL